MSLSLLNGLAILCLRQSAPPRLLAGNPSRQASVLQALGLTVLLSLPQSAQAIVCRAPPLILRITLQDTTCVVGQDTVRRRDAPDRIECLLSNPQLRIITLMPDGRFTYDDTDNDTFREGLCTPD